MARLHLVGSEPVDIAPVGCPLTDEIRRAGRKMEHAMAEGQRDLAVVWMRCMYGLIAVRNGAAQGADIQTGGTSA